MCKGLGLDRSFDLVHPLCGDTDLIFTHRFFGFSAAVVVQNSFPNSPKAHNHWS
jgi:hypothetical protein